MTDEQIIELVEQFFTCNCSVMEYSARKEDIIKFAQAIYDEGYEQHRKDILGEELYYG